MDLNETFKSERNRLFSYAYQLIKNVELTEETLQDVQINIWQNPSADTNQPFNYLMTATRFAAEKKLRGRTNFMRSYHVSDAALENVPSGESADARLEFLETEHLKSLRLEQVRVALNHLKPKQRAVIQAYMRGLTPYEYARTTGSNKFTAATNFKCGIQKLQKLLGVQK